MPDTSLINNLKNILGADLLSFMLSVEVAEIDQLSPNQLQIDALSKLEPCVEMFRGQTEFERPLNIAQSLCTYQDSLGTSWATYLHYFCAGNVLPGFESVRDATERKLMLVARDTYPVFLIQKDKFGTPSTFATSYMHPLRKEFSVSIMKASNPIRKLFPSALSYQDYKENPDALLSVSRNIIMSNGQIGTVSAGMMLESILSSSTYTPGDTVDPLVAYADSTRMTYRKIKRLANGGEVMLSTLLGLGNVDLDQDIELIEMQNIVIRRPSPVDNQAIFGEVGETSLVVEITDKVKILDSYDMNEEDSANPFARYDTHKTVIDKYFARQQDSIGRVRLSMLLASDDGSFIAPSYSFTTSLSPLSLSRSASLSPYRWSTRYERQTVSSSHASNIKQWFRRSALISDKLNVSIKRLISATTERMDDSDAFIDAVMVWENLFGAKQETTLRIKGAMSLLLEPSDKDRRKSLMKEISALYDKRSRLVHGSPNVDTTNMHDERTRSIELALESLRCVLRTKSLLHAKDSETRGQIIMFNVTG